jgi:nondiscriminating aspartyl-tRNA synthetase
MRRTLTTELAKEIGRRATVQGWVHRRRRLSAVSFLIVRDRSGLAQVVVRDEDGLEQLDDLNEETVVCVDGLVTPNAKAPGGCELIDPHITTLSTLAATPPVELWRPCLNASLPTLLDHAPVLWRHRTQQAIWRLAAASLRGFRRTLDEQDFTEIQTPKLVANTTESGANVFVVDYFGRSAYLAQSPQFYKQIMVGVFERVYETGTVFRAEPHDTVRHLAEYVSLDAEVAFITDHRDVLSVLRDVVAGMVAEIRRSAAEDAKLVGADLPEVPDKIPMSISETPFNWSEPTPTNPIWHRSRSASWVGGRSRSLVPSSWPWRVIRPTSAPSTPIRSLTTRAGQTRSI